MRPPGNRFLCLSAEGKNPRVDSSYIPHHHERHYDSRDFPVKRLILPANGLETKASHALAGSRISRGADRVP